MSDHGYMVGGLESRYVVTKSNGEPLDPNAQYFVLRYDKDPHAAEAILAYAKSIFVENPQLSCELLYGLHQVAPKVPGLSDFMAFALYECRPRKPKQLSVALRNQMLKLQQTGSEQSEKIRNKVKK